jgi:hypothetical protein
VRAARGAARAAAWAAGAGPDLTSELFIDFDATITIAHSEKENAAKTWKKTFGYHPLLAFLDRPDVSGGEALAGLLRPGNAGSNTAADHVTVLDMALAALPEQALPRPGDPTGPTVVARSDSAGATHVFAATCRARGVGFSFGFPVDERVQGIVDLIPERCWSPALEGDGEIRDGAWVAEATGLLDLSNWPEGSRLILRKERPHPGAQLTFTDADGHRITAVLTDTRPRVVPGQAPGLELRHRQHARVEDRILLRGSPLGPGGLIFRLRSSEADGGNVSDRHRCGATISRGVSSACVAWLSWVMSSWLSGPGGVEVLVAFLEQLTWPRPGSAAARQRFVDKRRPAVGWRCRSASTWTAAASRVG